MPSSVLIYVIAGEPSGDQLGAHLMAALKRELRRESSADLHFAGVGGGKMEAEGMSSLFDMVEISHMGLTEILPHIVSIKRRIRETARDIIEKKPDVVITIDAPGFTHRVIQQVRNLGSTGPFIHYVAPTVWAWKPGRAKKLSALVDELMVLLPFEPPYFEEHGLTTTFVGHPVAHSVESTSADFQNRKTISVLPGSRTGELKRHLPVFRKVIEQLAVAHPELNFALLTLPHLEATLREKTKGWAQSVQLVSDAAEKRELLQDSALAIAASGTVSVELAAAGVPQIIAYRAHPLTAAIVQRMVKIKYASLINLLCSRQVVPECLQQECRSEVIASHAKALLDNPSARQVQLDGYAKALDQLRVKEDFPSQIAAQTVLKSLNLAVAPDLGAEPVPVARSAQ